MFFFEKKNQKTFAYEVRRFQTTAESDSGRHRQKSFLVRTVKGVSSPASCILKKDDAVSQGEDSLKLPALGSASEASAAIFCYHWVCRPLSSYR